MTRVLIVDDLPHVAEQQAYDLRRVAGHETIVAAGGEAALALLAAHEVDAIVLDHTPDLAKLLGIPLVIAPTAWLILSHHLPKGPVEPLETPGPE